MTDQQHNKRSELDLLVLGSGIAGLTAAVRASAHGLRVGVLTKGPLTDTATQWAQGGVAAVLGGMPDSTASHIDDTLRAGAGLCDADAVRVLVEEGPDRVRDLIGLGAVFDRDATGALALAREGGHSFPRVVHAGGAATGAEIERTLVDAVRATAAAVHERCFVLDLVVEHGHCRGVRYLDAAGVPSVAHARHVLLATGGAGQLFALTTNPLEATGDGVAMALRAGVAVADIEFVQFHPTVLAIDALPRPLLSEALRGDGALLRNAEGERFVDELQPRDIVARAITQQMIRSGRDSVWLDATPIPHFAHEYPSLAAVLARSGLDASRDWLPVAPAAHYLCGGVVTDLDGATSLPGLWAAGEVSCTGVHGANRLASNSLLEGLVFGARAVDALLAGRDAPRPTGAMRSVLGVPAGVEAIGGRTMARLGAVHTADRSMLQRTMTLEAGVMRSAASLERAGAALQPGAERTTAERGAPAGRAELELANLATLAAATLAAATRRSESRGAHARTDFPSTSDAELVRSVFVG